MSLRLESIHAMAVRHPTYTPKGRTWDGCSHPFKHCSFFELRGGGDLIVCNRCGADWTTLGGEWQAPALAVGEDLSKEN